MTRRNLASEIMDEVILYGGLPLRRADVYTLAMESMGEHARSRFGADYFAFHPKPIDAEPMSIERARQIMED